MSDNTVEMGQLSLHERKRVIRSIESFTNLAVNRYRYKERKNVKLSDKEYDDLIQEFTLQLRVYPAKLRAAEKVIMDNGLIDKYHEEYQSTIGEVTKQ